MQGMQGMHGMQGNMDMRNMLAGQFLNRATNMNNAAGYETMAPFFPMQQGQFSNCGNAMGEMGAITHKKKRRKKKKKKKYYSSSSSSSSSSSESSSDEEKKPKHKKKKKKDVK